MDSNVSRIDKAGTFITLRLRTQCDCVLSDVVHFIPEVELKASLWKLEIDLSPKCQ